MSELSIQLIPALLDNYAYLLRDGNSGQTAVVDPSEAAPVLEALKKNDWSLDYILNTHHHWDHTGGNIEVKAATGCQIVGSYVDRDRIPGITITVEDGAIFELGAAHAKILLTPGHTRGAICYWFETAAAVFTGDTLFTMGCGRVFEGTYPQMWQSLDRLRQLPDTTQIYCGHEYTVKNAQFALGIEPENPAVQTRLNAAETARAKAQATIPATIAEERATNPFFRPESKEIRSGLGLSEASDAEVFAALREAKNQF